MPDLKPLSKEAIPQALAKATRYRLLNEPWQAESICRDVLRTEPGNQDALYSMILALTEQFGQRYGAEFAPTLALAEKLSDPYVLEYCRGIIHERQAMSALETGSPHAGYIAYDHLRKAMALFEKAETLRPADNEDPTLRWNACVRLIKRHSLKPSPEEEARAGFGEY